MCCQCVANVIERKRARARERESARARARERERLADACTRLIHAHAPQVQRVPSEVMQLVWIQPHEAYATCSKILKSQYTGTLYSLYLNILGH